MQISENELLKRLIIADASFFTLKEKALVTKNIDSFNDLAIMSINDFSSIIKRPLTKCSWDGKKVLEKAETAMLLIERLGIKWTFFDSTDYPVLLKEMIDSPYVLFYRGNLDCLKEKCVSMVGTRRATCSGKQAATDFARAAGNDNTTVVSGLAFGIDIFSHRGALMSNGGKTAAILPGGIDTIVPASHTKTAVKIIEKGGIIMSEYTPGTPPQPFRFVQRNRIIAGLSPATVVVQAPSGSGSMITASFALDYNRYVFFHEACFDGEAEMLKKHHLEELRKLALTGKSGEQKVKNKLLNSPEKYVEDGAPVIKSYEEYTAFLHDFSGEAETAFTGAEDFSDFEKLKIKRKNGQMDLFEN